MSSKNNNSLYNICLLKVTVDIQSYKPDLSHPFCGLPPTVCEDLMVSTILSNPNALTPAVLKFLLRPGIIKVDLTFYRYNFCIQGMSEICMRITYLNLFDADMVTERNLEYLVSQLTNVIWLDFGRTQTTDVVLCTIARRCFLIEKLVISYCPVSDVGLSFLYCHQERKHCSRLKVLDVSGTRITADTLAECLEYLPLYYVHVEEEVHFEMVISYVKRNINKTCELRRMHFYGQQQKIQLSAILRCCPYLQTLHFYKYPISDKEFLALSELNDLCRLHLTVDKTANVLTFGGISGYLASSGEWLKKLCLENLIDVNLYLIGLYCKQLQDLHLSRMLGLSFKRIWNLNSKLVYQNLKRLSIIGRPGDLLEKCVKSLLINSPVLTDLTMSRISCLTDSFIAEMIEYLKPLDSFHIYYCKNITVTSLYHLIDNLSLSQLSIMSTDSLLTPAEEISMKNYIKNNSLLVCISYVWIPHRDDDFVDDVEHDESEEEMDM